MNKKGELNIGVLLVIAVAIIIVLAMLPSIANYSKTVTTEYAASRTVTLGAANVQVKITGIQGFGDTPTVINATGGETIEAANYTITSNFLGSDGSTNAVIKANTGGQYANQPVNITTAKAEFIGYATDGASRSIVDLIVIFACIAVVVFAIYPAVKGPLQEYLG